MTNAQHNLTIEDLENMNGPECIKTVDNYIDCIEGAWDYLSCVIPEMEEAAHDDFDRCEALHDEGSHPVMSLSF